MLSGDTFLVFHTAFIGDVLLTLPMVQALRARIPGARISMVAIPAAAGVLHNHPALDEVILYDKKGDDRGFRAAAELSRRIARAGFEVALVPHRSLRSAAIVRFAGIPRRIGFSRSAGRHLLTDIVPYDPSAHEIERNLSLLRPLGISGPLFELPRVYPGPDDVAAVDAFLDRRFVPTAAAARTPLVALAPGSVWNTKRWPEDRFEALAHDVLAEGLAVVLIGGKSDEDLCRRITSRLGKDRIANAAGSLTLLQSAELIRRCAALVSNDSAPMHLAVAVRTPVVAIFGATVPEFGFAPRGQYDRIVERTGLSCRPCSIHGGQTCPIKTFDCMNDITPSAVLTQLRRILHGSAADS